MIEKIENGDFDYSPYFEQASKEYIYLADELISMENEFQHCRPATLKEKATQIITQYTRRIRRLTEDADRDEQMRIAYFKEILRAQYGGTRSQLDEFINTIEGTLKEAALYYPKWLMNKNDKKYGDLPF